MSEEFEDLEKGIMDLEQTSALDFLCKVADMCDKAPQGSDPYLEIEYKDNFGAIRVMRMVQLESEIQFHPTVQ